MFKDGACETIKGIAAGSEVSFYVGLYKHGLLKEGIVLIQKPFTRQGLALKVREVLDK